MSTFLGRATGWILLAGGGVGALAAFVLILDRIALLEDPEFVPACSIDPVLSCGSIMSSPQSEVFGFPNPLIGLLAFPVVATLGAAVVGGVVLPRWMWLGLQVGATAGVLFVHWLIAQSLYVIGALCPYCMAVWVVTITVFWYSTLHNLGRRPAGSRLAEYHGAVLAAWLVALATLVAVRFWPYWTGLLS
ncbi:vitamin K epoxide reductase family protein [Pseudonocardia broussonetiae]|uniref:Vitamin K epoxide reductase family protein n=2 Tax=Pseudonocardia broussonetiae TaxID=2736640 RepID=A0A6M6JTM8_9PSEU|nr:vitamin K epoxide reductase family protein [Pseudonocardia broussonetiae]